MEARGPLAKQVSEVGSDEGPCVCPQQALHILDVLGQADCDQPACSVMGHLTETCLDYYIYHRHCLHRQQDLKICCAAE